MFDALIHPFDDIANVIFAVVVTVGAVAGTIAFVYAQIKKGKSDADSVTIKSYQDEMTVLKAKVERLETESKEDRAKMNQLVGENKILKELVTYQDPNFRETIKSILEEIKQMRQDFESHTKQDDLRFKEIGDKTDRNYKALKEGNK